MGYRQVMQADFFVVDIGERVFGSEMSDYVGDHVSVNYFAELLSPQ